MAIWVVHIENWRPHTVNELLDAHHHKRSRMKQADAQMIGYTLYDHKVPKATGKRSVEMTITNHKGRGVDPDACFKSLLDGLVKTGHLIDDSSLYLDLKAPIIKRGKMKATTITLEDVE